MLKKLGAEKLNLGLATGMLKAQARSMLYRKSSTILRMRGERKSLEIACFLRLQLLRLTDNGLTMIDYRIANLWRQAKSRAEATVEDELRRHQALVLQLNSLLEDQNLSDASAREQMHASLSPFLPTGIHGPATKVDRIRRELATAGKATRELLNAATSISLNVPPAHPLEQTLAIVGRVAHAEKPRLPEGTPNPFGRTWAFLIDQPDREAAFKAYRAATLMRRIEAEGRLPAANRVILDHFRNLPVTGLWGGGTQASADMMSLDASRRLWNARHDPRRRTPAIGTYTHMLDQWAILHDQAVVLNRRQAGAAIEGALRHEAVDLHRLAVDTHGHTHFGMALAKLVGFDLAPRLARLHKRKLYLPRGIDVPVSLRSVVSETVSIRAITRGWDALLRITASTKNGWCSATYVLDRFGSAARGDEAFQAGGAFGRLLLTRFLGTHLGNPAFRAMNDALLSQGESVHTLQRAIYSGPIGPGHGRTPEQMATISSSLTLLTNVIMTWNANRIGEVSAQMPEMFPDHQIRRIAPNAHEHINTKASSTG